MAQWNTYEAKRKANESAEENTKWDNMIAMLNMANKTTPDTMLGYGLGRMLNRWIGTAWDDYLRSKNKSGGTEASTQKGLLPDTMQMESASVTPQSADVSNLSKEDLDIAKQVGYDPYSAATLPTDININDIAGCTGFHIGPNNSVLTYQPDGTVSMAAFIPEIKDDKSITQRG